MFVKDIYVGCEKMTRNGPKSVILMCGTIFNASGVILVLLSFSIPKRNISKAFSIKDAS